MGEWKSIEIGYEPWVPYLAKANVCKDKVIIYLFIMCINVLYLSYVTIVTCLETSISGGL